MNDIEKKALALVNEVSDGFHDVTSIYSIHTAKALRAALCRAIEQHEAFRQEVSDAIVVALLARLTPDHERLVGQIVRDNLARFIIAKPADPLAECLRELELSENDEQASHDAAWLVKTLAKRGGRIVWENSDA